ncbi:hypothetical protein A0H81_11170 [Grifola frondosa]|uniref:Uncharacterized protein n=1 Tax=Grifola frondosa TaxID=5627 RepID=A0A1C7LXN4_GRIFR|nr:hypothetical protein A0H81_11170 [Grifola frondosa]
MIFSSQAPSDVRTGQPEGHGTHVRNHRSERCAAIGISMVAYRSRDLKQPPSEIIGTFQNIVEFKIRSLAFGISATKYDI